MYMHVGISAPSPHSESATSLIVLLILTRAPLSTAVTGLKPIAIATTATVCELIASLVDSVVVVARDGSSIRNREQGTRKVEEGGLESGKEMTSKSTTIHCYDSSLTCHSQHQVAADRRPQGTLWEAHICLPLCTDHRDRSNLKTNGSELCDSKHTCKTCSTNPQSSKGNVGGDCLIPGISLHWCSHKSCRPDLQYS